MSLGENLARQRKEKGMSQAELAEALNVSRQAVSKWEQDISIPSVESLIRLRELFGISIDGLIDGEQPPQEQEPAQGPAFSPRPARAYQKWILPLVCILLVLAAFFAVKIWKANSIPYLEELPHDRIDLSSAGYTPLKPLE